MAMLRKMLSEEQVLDTVPLSRSTLWRMERAGKFPKSTYISPNRRVWFEDEVIAWQNSVNEFQPDRGRGFNRRKARKLVESHEPTRTGCDAP